MIVSLRELVLWAIKDHGRLHINSSYLETSSLALLPGSFNRSKSMLAFKSTNHLLNAGNCSSCSGVTVSGIWNLPGCVFANLLSEHLAWWQGLGPTDSQLKIWSWSMNFSWLIDVDGASCEKEEAGRRSELICFLLMSNFVHVFLLLSITSIFIVNGNLKSRRMSLFMLILTSIAKISRALTFFQRKDLNLSHWSGGCWTWTLPNPKSSESSQTSWARQEATCCSLEDEWRMEGRMGVCHHVYRSGSHWDYWARLNLYLGFDAI